MSGSSDLRQGFSGALFGAFFAFLVLRLGEFLTRIYARQKENHTTLVELEYTLNYALDTVGRHRQTLRRFVEIADNTLGASEGEAAGFMFLSFEKIPDPRDHRLTRLANLDLTNELVDLGLHTEKANNTLASVASTGNFAAERFACNDFDRTTFLACLAQEARELRQADAFLADLFGEVKTALSRTRAVASLSLPLFGRATIRLLPHRSYSKTVLEEAKRQSSSLDAEIENSWKKSDERIRTIEQGTDSDLTAFPPE